MAKLRPWYQVVTPREDLRENRPLDASEFAVHLDHIRDKRAHEDYVKPERFFERTYMTKSLLDLSAQVVRRLSGIKVETSAVFNMATQFGGGKTHSLTAQYHLARGGDAAKSWRGVDAILSRAQVKTVPKANVAVFVGTEFDVLDGRGGDGEPHRKTPWGEIAWQLGGEKSFAAVAKHDEQGIAPAGDVIRKMLPKEPSLILMDELLNYVNKARKTGLASQLYDFLQSLSEEARAQDHVVLCVSIPASELEMNPEDQRDYDSYKKMLDRVGKAISMSSDVEVTEIIRRRLFDWHGLSDDMQRTATAYAEWAQRARHGGQQPRGRRGRGPVPDMLPLPPERDLGLRAKMAEPAPVSEDPGNPPFARTLGFVGLPRGAPEGVKRTAHHARLRPARRPDLPRRRLRAARDGPTLGPRDDRHRRQEGHAREEARQGSQRIDPQKQAPPEGRDRHLHGIQRRPEPEQGRSLIARDSSRGRQPGH